MEELTSPNFQGKQNQHQHYYFGSQLEAFNLFGNGGFHSTSLVFKAVKSIQWMHSQGTIKEKQWFPQQSIRQPSYCIRAVLLYLMYKQGTVDAGLLKRTQSAGVTQWVSQHSWRTWIGDILGQTEDGFRLKTYPIHILQGFRLTHWVTAALCVLLYNPMFAVPSIVWAWYHLTMHQLYTRPPPAVNTVPLLQALKCHFTYLSHLLTDFWATAAYLTNLFKNIANCILYSC